MGKEYILEVKNLTVRLGNVSVIDNLSFKVKRGEILTIVGPNGAGKTVLLRTLLGFLPHQGEINWQKGVKIGYLPQGLTFLKVRDLPLSVKEFFLLKTKNENKIQRCLSLVGLPDKEIYTKRIGDLSGGQFQRMLIAWALINEPQVLLFDEPTTGVDIGGAKTIYSLLFNCWKEYNLTIILVTHDLNIVYKYSTNVLCLNKDRFCYGPPQDILTPEALKRIYGPEIKFYKHRH